MLPNLTHTCCGFGTSCVLGGHSRHRIRTRELSDLRFRWRKLASLLLVLKSSRLVSAIAKRLICRVAAAAESDCCASGKAIRLALHVNELDFSFDTQRAIISNYNFS